MTLTNRYPGGDAAVATKAVGAQAPALHPVSNPQTPRSHQAPSTPSPTANSQCAGEVHAEDIDYDEGEDDLAREFDVPGGAADELLGYDRDGLDDDDDYEDEDDRDLKNDGEHFIYTYLQVWRVLSRETAEFAYFVCRFVH
jgi:hypothetical protein